MKENKIAGVYKVTNNITGDFYIGSSQNIEKRWYQHKNPAFWKQHSNVKLYQIMAKYGRDNFTIDVIEETDKLRELVSLFISTFYTSITHISLSSSTSSSSISSYTHIHYHHLYHILY